LPWQLWCERNRGQLKVLPINDDGTLQINKLEQLITSKTKLITVAYVSNTLGIINPVDEIIKIAKFNNVPVLIDGAQAVPHMKVDVNSLGADFFVFSGHKM